MASIYPKKVRSKTTGKVSTTWCVGFYQDGKHRSKSAGHSKTVAEKLKRQIEAELQSGKFDFLSRPEAVPIDQSVASYLEHILTLRKSRTWWRYKNALAHLLQFLEAKYPSIQSVGKLAPLHFTDYQQWRRSTKTTGNGRVASVTRPPAFKTINIETSICRSWLNWAISMGHRRDNPLQGIRRLKTSDSKRRRVLTRDEYAELIVASLSMEQEIPGRYGQTQLWRFLVNTGMRIGELTHLEWNDIDFRRQVIKVQSKANWDPKTYEREIPMTEESAAVLNEIRASTKEKDGLIFRFPTGKGLRESTIRVWLIECATRAELKGVRGPHDLRHTFITLALTEFGIDIPTVQKVAGHRNLETTQIYLHPTTEHIKTAIKKFEI